MEIRLQREFDESLGRAYARTNTKKKGEEGAKAESAENAAERGRPSPEYMTEALIRRRTGVVRGPLGGVTELVVRPNRKDNRRVYKIENHQGISGELRQKGGLWRSTIGYNISIVHTLVQNR